jgi:hypothetical protein
MWLIGEFPFLESMSVITTVLDRIIGLQAGIDGASGYLVIAVEGGARMLL